MINSVGGLGNDIISGGAGDDYILAQTGNDTITTGTGTDQVTAGIGNDTITIDGVGDKTSLRWCRHRFTDSQCFGPYIFI